jgi:hypothetical protein
MYGGIFHKLWEEAVSSHLRTVGVYGNWLCHLKTGDMNSRRWNTAFTLRGLWECSEAPVLLNEVRFSLRYFNKEFVTWGNWLLPAMLAPKQTSLVFMQPSILLEDVGHTGEYWLNVSCRTEVRFQLKRIVRSGIHPAFYPVDTGIVPRGQSVWASHLLQTLMPRYTPVFWALTRCGLVGV